MKVLGFSVACIVLALSACTTQEQRDAANEASCTKWGTGPGSPRFAECMAMLRSVDASVAAADAQRMIAAGAALQAAGASLKGPETLNCTSIQTGAITNTTCN